MRTTFWHSVDNEQQKAGFEKGGEISHYHRYHLSMSHQTGNFLKRQHSLNTIVLKLKKNTLWISVMICHFIRIRMFDVHLLIIIILNIATMIIKICCRRWWYAVYGALDRQKRPSTYRCAQEGKHVQSIISSVTNLHIKYNQAMNYYGDDEDDNIVGSLPHISEAITHPAKPRRLAAPLCYSDDADDENSQ